MKILLVSDDDKLVKSCKTILTMQLGLKETLCAENANDAITQIENATETNSSAVLFGGSATKSSSIKLVIVDELIAGKPAADLIRNIRKLFDKKELPVILFTAGENKEELIKTLQAGANNFVLKPTNAEILNKKIAEVLGKGSTPKIEAAPVFSQKKPVVKKRETQSPLLQMLSSSKKKGGDGRLIGAYYNSSKTENKSSGSTDEKSQPIPDDGTLINGHYHEEVNVIGGGINCFWAKEKPDAKQIALEYISAKGKPSGVFVKNISKEDFLKNFHPCTPQICNIMKRNIES